MEKFITLHVSHLRLDDLAGLATETIVLCNSKTALGAVGLAKLQALNTANTTFLALVNKNRASALTPQIREEDKRRDAQLAEIKRTAKDAQKSTQAATAAAGTKLMEHLLPFWDISKEPIPSQSIQIEVFNSRYAADAAAVTAAATLGLTPVLAALLQSNNTIMELYNERLADMGALDGPSATAASKDVITAYDDFCTAVEVTLSALPTADLQLIFNELNDLRRKYVSRLPKDLGAGDHTVIEPIDTQKYTERPITLVPEVHYREEGKETVRLYLGTDFSVTYKNNVNVGMAELTIHGKGKYRGAKTATFNIAR